MDLELAGRSVVVTGASRGIGRAIAEAFAAEGALLTICARGAEALERTRDEIARVHPDARVRTRIADVTDPGDAAALISGAAEAHGGLDVLVNNAGGAASEGTPDQTWRGTFERNVVSVLRLMELAKPHLLASSAGAVVNVSSIYGREAGGSRPHYSASKAAQIAISKAYALAWAREGLRVNNVAPGSVAFEGGGWERLLRAEPERMAAFIEREIPGGRFGRPEEVAAAVVFLASPVSSWVVGASLNVDGGQSRSNV